MTERTEEVTEEAHRDPEASEAIAEAQSVIDRVESVGETDAGPASDAGGERREGRAGPAGSRGEADADAGSGSRLPSFSLPSPSLSLPSPSAPDVGSLFSPRRFALALVLAGAAFVAARTVLPIGSLAGPLGLLVVAFVWGLVDPERSYLEVGLANVLVGAVLAVVTSLAVAVAGGDAAPLAALGGGIGLAVGILGLYLGRDLRAGLTKSVS